MKKTFTFLLILCMLTVQKNIFAQLYFIKNAQKKIPEASQIAYREGKTLPSYIRLKEYKDIDIKNWKNWLSKSLKLNPDIGFSLQNLQPDSKGGVHYRFIQTYKNIPVFGKTYIVHTKNNMLISVNGDIIPSVENNAVAAIDEEKALKYALKYFDAEIYKWLIPAEETMLKRISGNTEATYYPKGELYFVPAAGDLKSGNYRLAYRFDIYSSKPLKREYVFVDASTGEIIFTLNRIQTTDVPGIAHTKYSGVQTIVADTFNGSFRLREAGRGKGIETFNMQQGYNQSSAVDFTDADNDWNNFNPQLDEVATDAHWGTEMTYDYFYNKYNWNSIDNNKYKLTSFVHLGYNFVNAFWDGWYMNYGDGDGITYGPLTSIDICGHEITHGLDQNTADLIYSYESGALNEGYSDIFGTCVEWYARPGNADWKISADFGPPFRDISDPNSLGLPDTYHGTNWYYGTGDNGGVHTNCGVLGYWFYLLTQGGSGINDNNDAYIVNGIGMDSAAAIAFRTLTVYLSPDADYADARFYSILSAYDLFGACSDNAEAVTNAWYAVGVGSVYDTTVSSDFTADKLVFCSHPATVQFSNTGTGASNFFWDFGDGNTSVLRDPAHTYNSVGDFTVSLIADGGACGKDTMIKIAYISVDTTTACVINMPEQGTGDVQTACSGTLFDSGGNSDYQNNTNSSITICPNGASQVTLNFTSFGFESWWDFLYIYDGTSASSPLIGMYTGYSLPEGGTIVSTGSAITLVQVTDNYFTDSGFELTWQCSYPSAPPVAAFSAGKVSYCSVPADVQFVNSSVSANQYLWDFGDGATSTDISPLHTYNSFGDFTVTLIAYGGTFGQDTLIKTSYISVDSMAACIAQMPESGTAPTQTGCSGCLYDSGGSINYQDNTSGVITIAPAGATSVTLTFFSFAFEQNFDYLYVYDGPSTSSPMIGAYTGFTLPNGGIITSSAGSVTIEQYSDPYVNEAGFELSWQCTKAGYPPVANFYVNEDTFCNSPVSVQFFNISSNSNYWHWDFGDGDTSNLLSPNHDFTSYGDFTVTLIAFGVGGSDTITSVISVDSTNNCTVNLPQTGTAPTQAYCYGNLFDSGGTGDYQSYTDGIITIAPPGATNIILNFVSFGFELAYDYLYIFDGPSTSSPLIGVYTGFSLPNGGTIVSSTGVVTIRQFSDQYINESGFELYWQCSYTGAPIADFSANTTSNCSGDFDFTDLTVNSPTSWQWNFGDGNTSSLQNPSHTYSNPGVYDVTLIAANAVGSDTVVKTAYLTVLSQSTEAAGINSSSNPACLGNPAILTVIGGNTGYGAAWKWYSGSCGGTSEGAGSSISVSPVAATTYYVRAEGSCNTTNCVSLDITVINSPAIFDVSGGGSYCSEISKGVNIDLSGTETGVNYSLIYAGSPLWALVPGNGSPITFANQIAAGTYSVLATNTVNGCQQIMSGTACVSIYNCPGSEISTAINTSDELADSSAILDINDTISGILLPRITDAGRDTLISPDEGLIIYNISTGKLNYYNSRGWHEVNSSPVSSVTGFVNINYGVSINSTGAESANSAILDIDSKIKGVLIPRTLPGAVFGAAKGSIIYNTATDSICCFNGTAWTELTATIISTSTGTGSQPSGGCAVNPVNSSPAPSAILDVSAQNKSLLIPRLSDNQRNRILPDNGLIIYNTSADEIQYFHQTSWYRLQ